MGRPAFLRTPDIALNILLNKERAKVSTTNNLNRILLLTIVTLDLFQIMLEGQKVVPKRVRELGFQYQYPDINSACAEILGKSMTSSK